MPGGKAASQSVAAQEEGLVVIGKGTRVHGKIGDCRKLDVHGILEADVVADTLVVREGGGIKGTVQTDNMEIYGVFEGTLIVHEHLSIESTGHVTGEISYRTLAIQTGAQVNGTVICREQEVAAEPESATTADIIPINGAHRTEINGGDLGMQNSGAGSWAGQG
jgi:cytoskeletal protein CcmA (bactofilin family)